MKINLGVVTVNAEVYRDFDDRGRRYRNLFLWWRWCWAKPEKETTP